MSGFTSITLKPYMTEPNLFLLLVTGIFIGAASGYLGSFMVLKRMSLVGDALSHVALPGVAIALVFHISPMIGAMAALTFATIGVWYLEQTSSVYPEALVGVFFTASLALGILLTPEPELLESLFGSMEKITLVDGLVAIWVSIAILIMTKMISKQIVLGAISEELAQSVGISGRKINLLYLLLVGIVVALGVKYVGTLLMGALVIIPAVSAKNISKSMNQYYLFSIVFGVLSTLVGAVIAHSYQLSTGPVVVLTSIVIFCITFVVMRMRRQKNAI
ncbi:MAG: ABC-3 protein [Candidatus Gottesmanbacteria bacterium GW2011_GWB1_44_11c]|uniref:ABC-3 protein n=1 Tax=Candidatus Gottesmanbacteria bacterium GW2011_GWB1_44_11c TaxID=1618447 RepID=A0A0G1GVK0_9BACT|nr:MAG: ABC-3 protein [Candidatus Gottesmanbacteria bacterium GW2011_GWB1_44_11c]HCM81816.1 ABC transporter [Patescibacteria group bacterium]